MALHDEHGFIVAFSPGAVVVVVGRDGDDGLVVLLGVVVVACCCCCCCCWDAVFMEASLAITASSTHDLHIRLNPPVFHWRLEKNSNVLEELHLKHFFHCGLF